VFEDFTISDVDIGDVRLRVRHGGSGSPVVLLHGHPRTHATWHRVAPLLAAAGHRVICPDLRGYGASTAPPDAPDHRQASKRAMALDVCELMSALGHERFAVVGHDRGAYVAFRCAMDHPDRVGALGILDAVPIIEALDRTDATFAAAWWHWWFLGQTDKPAEPLILVDPDRWYQPPGPEHLGSVGHRELIAALHDPDVVHAMCEDYRAGLTIDRDHDAYDRDLGRTLRCPTLVLWASDDDQEELYGDPLEPWCAWAPDLTGGAISSGHHIAEDAPEDLVARLNGFLAAAESR
jgi:haloacetate dehalogenase